jgi:hypothetical protein
MGGSCLSFGSIVQQYWDTRMIEKKHCFGLYIVTLIAGAALMNLTAFAQDTSIGIIWYPKMQLSEDAYDANSPVIAISGTDTLHVTWAEGIGLQHKIPYIKSTDGGKTWSGVRDLIKDSTTFGLSYNSKQIVAQGENVYIFSGQEQSPSGRVVMSKSTDCGMTWTTRRIGIDSSNDIHSATLMNDTLTVLCDVMKSGYFVGTKVIFSVDAGQSWDTTSEVFPYYTNVAYTPNTVHVVTDLYTPTPENLYLQSHDLGKTYTKRDTLSEVDGLFAFEKDIASAVVEKEQVIVTTWRDEKFGGGFLGASIMLRESRDNGKTWLPREILTEQHRGFIPSITTNQSGLVAVAWLHEVNLILPHVQVRTRKNKFSPWSLVKDLTPQERVVGLKVVASNNIIHILWVEDISGGSGPLRIFYRRGELFTKADTISYERGWNLVSIPVRTDSIYNLPSMFEFRKNGYIKADTMKRGIGYWSKLQAPDTVVAYHGQGVYADTIEVRAGWNLIGTISFPVAAPEATTIPPNIIVSDFYEYKGGYFISSILEPGKAYWVKVNQQGKLILRANY